MRVLVTGGAGFIDTHTFKKLIEKRHTPFDIDNLEKINNEAIKSKLNFPILKNNLGNKNFFMSILGIKKDFKVFGLDHSTFDGSCIRDFVRIIDFTKAHILPLEKLKNDLNHINLSQKNTTLVEQNCFTYNIGLGKGGLVLEIINKIEDIVDKCPYEVIENKKEDPLILIACSKKIKKELEWQHKYNIDETLIHSFNWIK